MTEATVNLGALGSLGTCLTGLAALGTLVLALRNGRRLNDTKAKIDDGNEHINEFHAAVAEHLGIDLPITTPEPAPEELAP